MIKSKSRIYITLVLVVLMLCLFIYNPAPLPIRAATTVNNFDKTNVLDDLTSSTVNGEPFSFKNYPHDVTGVLKSFGVMNFVEYCYSQSSVMQPNYALYVYIYNPHGLDFVTTSNLNKVMLAVAYDSSGVPTDYEKFSLKFCSVSTGEYDKRFYKYRIEDHKSADGKSILQRVNPAARRYDMSEIELRESGNANATAFNIGFTYTYTGYAAGCGPDTSADSTLSYTVQDLETIELSVYPTTFRTDTLSSLGANHYHDINSVYFSIPNRLLRNYGKLQKIKAEWWEYKTKDIPVLSNATIYNALLPHVRRHLNSNVGGSSLHLYDKNVPYSLGAERTQIFSDYIYHWNYNIFSHRQYSDHLVMALTWLLNSSGDVSSEELKAYISDYSADSLFFLPIKDGEISSDLFESFVDSGRIMGYNVFNFDTDDKFDLLSYDSSNSGWRKFLDGLLFTDTSVGYPDISPIYEVKASDLVGLDSAIAKKLYISEADVGSLQFLNTVSSLTDTTVFLFRYASTDYHVRDLYNGENDKVVGYLAQETMFFDFDILQLTFNKDGALTVIPVVMSPIDIIPDLTPVPKGSGCDDWRTVIIIVLSLILLAILSPVIAVIFNILFWLLGIFFKLISMPFKALKKRKSNKPKPTKTG